MARCAFATGGECVVIKLGLVLLVVLFGACTFIAGTMAPPSWRLPVAAFGEHLFGSAQEHTAARPARVGDTPAPAATAGAGGPPAVAVPASSGTVGPVRLDSLLVTAALQEPAPAKGQPVYALQLGQFTSDADAEAAMRRSETVEPGLPRQRIATIDAENEPWSVVAIGRYASPDAARRAAPRLQDVLGLRDLPVIRLPEPAPSGKSAP